MHLTCLQCIDTVGWAVGQASYRLLEVVFCRLVVAVAYKFEFIFAAYHSYATARVH